MENKTKIENIEKKEPIRILGRKKATELTAAELDQVAGGQGISCYTKTLVQKDDHAH